MIWRLLSFEFDTWIYSYISFFCYQKNEYLIRRLFSLEFLSIELEHQFFSQASVHDLQLSGHCCTVQCTYRGLSGRSYGSVGSQNLGIAKYGLATPPPPPSTLLYPVSLLAGGWDWVQGGDPLYAAVKCLMWNVRWSMQRANGKYKDHLVGQLTTEILSYS